MTNAPLEPLTQHLPSVLPPIGGPAEESLELEFERQLDRYQQQMQRQSFPRRALIRALSGLALASLEMANRLDT